MPGSMQKVAYNWSVIGQSCTRFGGSKRCWGNGYTKSKLYFNWSYFYIRVSIWYLTHGPVLKCAGHLEVHDEHDSYVPSELVGQVLQNGVKTYHCYVLQLERSFSYDIKMDHLILAASNELNFDDGKNIAFELEVDRGSLTVHIKYAGTISLTSKQVISLILSV